MMVSPTKEMLPLFVLIIGSSYIFKSFETIDFFFQAKVSARYSAWGRIIGIAISSLLKVLFILYNQSLICFIWAIVIENLFINVSFVILYRIKFKISPHKWKINIDKIKNLLKDGWPLILSGLAMAIYMKIDKVMLGFLTSDYGVGIYSAAARITEASYFIPVAISISLFPYILKSKNINLEEYKNRLQLIYSFYTWLSIFMSIIIYLIAFPLIDILYGKAYIQAVDVLQIHFFSNIFVFLGVASTRQLVAENKTKVVFYRSVTGAISNIILNYYFIKHYGIIGAAYASLISYGIANYFSYFFFNDTKHISKMYIKSLNPLLISSLIKKI